MFIRKQADAASDNSKGAIASDPFSENKKSTDESLGFLAQPFQYPRLGN